MIQSAGQFLLAWYNLPFTILILVCLVLAALQWIGLSGDQDSEADADHDIDHDVDVDHNIDHDFSHDADADGDAGADHDVDQDADGEASADHQASHDSDHAGSGFSLLAFVGMGKAPLMVVLLILFGAVGLFGWAFNGVVRVVLGFFPGLALGLTLPAALVLGGVISARVSRLIGQVLPPISTTATSYQSLVGRRATVVTPWVDQRFGQVRLHDAGGTMITLTAFTTRDTPIKRGEEVLLVDYQPEKKMYIVEKL